MALFTYDIYIMKPQKCHVPPELPSSPIAFYILLKLAAILYILAMASCIAAWLASQLYCCMKAAVYGQKLKVASWL